jgi:peptidase inhibitor family I36
MSRSWLPLMTIGLALLLVCPVGAQASQRKEQSGGHLRAVLVGPDQSEEDIELEEVGDHHCHDLASPTIRCFATELERDEDAESIVVSSAVSVSGGAELSGARAVQMAATAVTYVRWYEDSNYGGSSYSTLNPVVDMATIGWNDRISSFKSLNGGRPKWWQDSNYSGPWWQWITSAWVPYVGDSANDRFSSVKNVP